MNQAARVHELCRAIKWAEYGQTVICFAKHFRWRGNLFSTGPHWRDRTFSNEEPQTRRLQDPAQLLDWPSHSLGDGGSLFSSGHVGRRPITTVGETAASHLLSDRCCQSGVDRYSPPQLDRWTSQLSRFGASGEIKQTNKRRPESGGKKGKEHEVHQRCYLRPRPPRWSVPRPRRILLRQGESRRQGLRARMLQESQSGRQSLREVQPQERREEVIFPG